MADEMYTTKQAAIYVGMTERDLRLMIRDGKLRAWAMPLQPGLLVRKSDLVELRQKQGTNKQEGV